MTTTPTSGAAIQRYKIGYPAEEWSQRSRTPSGIPDASGSWVRYADHVNALAAGQATAAQGVAYAALPEYGINTASHAHFRVLGFTADQMRAFADATHTLRASHGQAPAGATEPTEQQILEAAFAPAQPAAEASRFGSPELQAMIIARCVEKDQAESVYAFRRKGLEDFCTCDDARYEELSNKPHLFETRVFYTAPQPSPTTQADSVPAVSDLPPLPAPDLRDVGTKPQEIKEFLKGYATEYARTAIAARAPAGAEESRTIPDREIPGIVEKALQELEGLVKYATSIYGHWDMSRAKGALSDLEWWARRKLAAHAQAADSVQEDAAREAIEKVLALFPFNVPIQKFTVNNGPCLTADNDDEFYSVKRVLAFLTEIKTTLDAARKKGATQ